MKPTSIPSSVSNRQRPALAALLGALLLSLATPAPAADPVAAHRLDGATAQDSLRDVLDRRCTVCHSLERVEAAQAAGRDMAKVQAEMVARGALLEPRDREVLGTFWGPPGPAVAPVRAAGPSVDPATYQQFQEIIAFRCTICHTRERIDEAMARQESLAAIEALMLQRGAVITEQERSILHIFWGAPQRQ